MTQVQEYAYIGCHDTEVVGFQHYYRELVAGETVTLVREPANIKDLHAVKVMNSEGKHVGYIPKPKVCHLSDLMDQHRLRLGGVIKQERVPNKYARPMRLRLYTKAEEAADVVSVLNERGVAVDTQASQAALAVEASPIRTFQAPRTAGFSSKKIQPANIASCSKLKSGQVFTSDDGERWKTGCLSYRDAEGVRYDFVHIQHSILETRGDAPYATPKRWDKKTQDAFIKLHVKQSDVDRCFPEVIGNRKFVGTEISIRNMWDAELGRYEPMHYSVFSPSYVDVGCSQQVPFRRRGQVVGNMPIKANLKVEVQRAFEQNKDLLVAVVGRPKVSTHEASQKLHANFNLRSIEILGTAPKALPRQGVDSASQIEQLTEMLAGTVIHAQ